ncbi:unnamed protein product [Laminaria digitata]
MVYSLPLPMGIRENDWRLEVSLHTYQYLIQWSTHFVYETSIICCNRNNNHKPIRFSQPLVRIRPFISYVVRVNLFLESVLPTRTGALPGGWRVACPFLYRGIRQNECWLEVSLPFVPENA